MAIHEVPLSNLIPLVYYTLNNNVSLHRFLDETLQDKRIVERYVSGEAGNRTAMWPEPTLLHSLALDNTLMVTAATCAYAPLIINWCPPTLLAIPLLPATLGSILSLNLVPLAVHPKFWLPWCAPSFPSSLL